MRLYIVKKTLYIYKDTVGVQNVSKQVEAKVCFKSNQTLNTDVSDFNLSLHERLPVLGQ